MLEKKNKGIRKGGRERPPSYSKKREGNYNKASEKEHFWLWGENSQGKDKGDGEE